ncbi:4-hydroxy-3-methylbut-2-enyl diphosphate reductase [Corallococcus silvisoli]|uniref:4-hydroxy-3-methylbut-2-enyl diphosphate reductase n=1 Tax=Corallococcus silvisoli TaxID=2697031 RepID=UPI0013782025|nr:4-hydroxy-3-methylbut-2-enyl diphosphate reductase [Corallococcus silvisoli]NBD08147.1 4-hydroxy-3-methylbut-2-enyl diphosphate reductase [Corallococcus silvisoli]
MTSRLSPWLTALVVLFALPVLAANASDTGAWVAAVREKELHLSLHPKDDPGSQSGFSAPFTAFQGLSTADGASTPFKLVREAGTFDFEGRFADGQGVGTWRFTPDTGYVKKLADLGLARPNAREQQLLAALDAGPQRIQGLAALGQKITTLHDLIQVGLFAVTPEYVRALAAAGYPKLSLDETVQSRIHGVTPERIQALATMGFKGLPLDSLLSMSIHGVTPDFIREMRGLGFKGQDADGLVSMRIHGVTAEFVKAMRGLGFKDVDAEGFMAMRIHGVTPEFVKEMRDLGYTNATADDFVSLRIHGIDSLFVRGMSKPDGGTRK